MPTRIQQRPRPDTTPSSQAKGPIELIAPKSPPAPSLLPRFKSPLEDTFEAGARARLSRPPEALNLPTDSTRSATVHNVKVPSADAKPSPTEAYVSLAAQGLGFSPEVAAIATTELARRLGNDLVVDLKTGTQRLTAADLAAADTDGDGTSSYTFDAEAIAVLKDANLAASLGLNSVEALYAKQASTVLPRLREAAINGTDVDLHKELQLINDPGTREALGAYYELTRTVRSLGHGDDDAFAQLPAARKQLADAMAKLPIGGPLNSAVTALTKEVDAAQNVLLQGTASAGKVPRSAIALLNNLAAAPLGKLPDEDVVQGALENIEAQAVSNGATPAQASALKEALGLASDLRLQGSSSEALREQNREKATALLARAGPFGQAAKPLLEKVLAQAPMAVSRPLTAPTVDPAPSATATDVSVLADRLALLAKGADVKALPDALKAIKNAADSIRKGDTAEGMVAGLKAAPAVISTVVELLRLMPELGKEASSLLKSMASVFKLPFDVMGTAANAKKAITGTDLDGKAVTQGERVNAAVDLVTSDIPGVVGTVAGLTGATTVAELAATVAPPLALVAFQARMIVYTLEEVAKMKGGIATHVLRDRFDLGDGDGAQFRASLDRQLETLKSAPTTRADQALVTSRALLTEQFKDVDTSARFRAFAASKLPGGRQTVKALMRGERIPAFIDTSTPGMTRTEGARTIETANRLKALAAQFYELETSEVRKQLDNAFRGRSGESYMTSRDERRELNHWLNR